MRENLTRSAGVGACILNQETVHPHANVDVHFPDAEASHTTVKQVQVDLFQLSVGSKTAI